MNIAVTGGDGVLARALRAFLPDATYLSREVCDVRDYWSVAHALKYADVVIHAAALTDHQHPNAAEVIETNVFGTENVARACVAFDRRLVYLSTHYVYPGVRGNYDEYDTVRPIGAYAWSKLAGEHWVEQLHPNALVVRGSWYTYRMRVAHWRRNGALTDAFCSREPVEDAARKIAALARTDAQGVVNIGGPRRSFHEIAREVCGDDVREITRAELERALALPYAFPRDISVSTEKFDAMGLVT